MTACCNLILLLFAVFVLYYLFSLFCADGDCRAAEHVVRTGACIVRPLKKRPERQSLTATTLLGLVWRYSDRIICSVACGKVNKPPEKADQAICTKERKSGAATGAALTL